jgi:hypothetical protein
VSHREAIALLACFPWLACTAPAPPPNLPGTLIGPFAFSGSLLLPGQDAGMNIPETTCVVVPDGGSLNPSATLSFYAYVSEALDAGDVWWQLISNGSIFSSECPGCGPLQRGSLDGGGFTIPISSCAPLASCGCVGAVDETVTVWQSLPDGGIPGSLLTPVLSFSGWIDDYLAAAAGAACLDGGGAQSSVCLPDAGLGCGINCDLVYTLSAVPGAPPF